MTKQLSTFQQYLQPIQIQCVLCAILAKVSLSAKLSYMASAGIIITGQLQFKVPFLHLRCHTTAIYILHLGCLSSYIRSHKRQGNILNMLQRIANPQWQDRPPPQQRLAPGHSPPRHTPLSTSPRCCRHPRRHLQEHAGMHECAGGAEIKCTPTLHSTPTLDHQCLPMSYMTSTHVS